MSKSVKKTVYMVDDDTSMCDLVGAVIRKSGYDFVSTNRFHGSVEFAEKHQPDLILLDLHLPDGSGLNLCSNLKANPETRHIPVFMLTTREFGIEKDVAFKAGVEHFFQKPFDREDLLSKINYYLLPALEVEFWGVRGSTPCANRENMIYGGNTTCVEIRIPDSDHLLILDSGSGIRNLGNKLIKEKKKLTGNIFITHPHWDHIQGFPFFKPIYIPDNEFAIHMPQQISGGCKEVLAGQMTYTYFPVTPEMLMSKIEYVTQQAQLEDFGDYKIEYMLANHPVTTAIYKIHVNGKVIVFCPDNELIPSEKESKNPFFSHLKEFFQDADLLVHDAQYNRASYSQKKNWGHSAWEEAVELCASVNVKHLYLTHHDPDSSDDDLMACDEEAQRYKDHFETVKFAREGLTHKIMLS